MRIVLAVAANELLKEQRTAAIMLLWSVIGVALLVLLWPKGRGRKLARQTFALAILGFREGIRMKILWTVAVLAVIPVMLAYFSDADGTYAGRARVILNISLACGEILGATLIVLLSALSVAREIESRIMHTLGAKPMPRWSILLGKALGFWAIDLLFVAGLMLFTAALVRAVPLRPESRAPGALVQSGAWSDLARSALTTRKFRGPENVHDESCKSLERGESYQQRFAVSPAESGQQELALRLQLFSTWMFESQLHNLGVKIGYEGETPFYNRVLDVPQGRPFEIFLEPKDVARSGTLLLTLTSPPDYPLVMVWQPAGTQLGVVADGFGSNLLKAFLLLALQGWLLALVVTGWSGVLSFPVAVALGLILVLGGEMSRYAVELMQTNWAMAQKMGAVVPERTFMDAMTRILNGVLLLLPDFRAAGGPAAFVEGTVLSAWAIAHAFFWMGVVRCLGWTLPGVLMFQSREVGK